MHRTRFFLASPDHRHRTFLTSVFDSSVRSDSPRHGLGLRPQTNALQDDGVPAGPPAKGSKGEKSFAVFVGNEKLHFSSKKKARVARRLLEPQQGHGWVVQPDFMPFAEACVRVGGGME